MSGTKKYYWLKLKEDFFNQKYVKALRRLPDGDCLTIIYLKMQLLTLNTSGRLPFEHIMPNCESEIALTIDEDENKVRFAIEALINMGVIEKSDNDDLYLLCMSEVIGSESDSAKRVREFRKRSKALQCNEKATTETDKETDTDIDKETDTENTLLSVGTDSGEPINYKNIVSLFNEICVSLPKIKNLSDNRKRNIKKANEILNGDFENFFRKVESSDFLTGRKGTWNGACFDWIIKPQNLIKIIEGNYNNKEHPQSRNTGSGYYIDYSEGTE